MTTNEEYGYEMIIYCSDQDESYIIDVPELPCCLAAGKTVEEAVKNAKEVVGEWIQGATNEGRDIPKPKG